MFVFVLLLTVLAAGSPQSSQLVPFDLAALAARARLGPVVSWCRGESRAGRPVFAIAADKAFVEVGGWIT